MSDSTLERALYSSDASLYRVVPAVVAHPRDACEVAAALEVCRALGVPLTCRGAGTSIAGNAIGAGLVLDFSRHMNRVLDADPGAAVATVQPGVVQDQLQQAVAGYGFRFGPDPSTRNRCTIGGMIGNNACGSRSLEYGRTSENVAALTALTSDGRELRLTGPNNRGGWLQPDGPDVAGGGRRDAAGRAARAGPDDMPDDRATFSALHEVIASGLQTIRTEMGRFRRQVSGYALEHLLPEQGFDVRRTLVGSEGTLAVVTEATVRLVLMPACRVLVALGYADMASAADAVPAILHFQPATCEGLDSRIVEVVRARRGPAAVPGLPRGAGWLFVEVTGDNEAAVIARAREVTRNAGALDAMVVTDLRQAAALWRIREDGAGLAGRTPAGAPAWPGWEDSAVPPGSLAPYLRDLDLLLADHGLTGVPYGHFGEGCLHLRLDFPLERRDGRGVLRAFLFDAARLVTRHGGSLSGEHGDGRTRSELLPIMYSAAAMDLFRQVKRVFDPGNLLNPGVVVDPAPVDADVRVGAVPPLRSRLALAYGDDGGDFTAAVHRCVGVGKCVADTTANGGVMCPSYVATRQEKDSTRGRARVLQEMVNGRLVSGSWRSPEVAAALDLCLACKACSSECPAGVDMASYKAEVLHQSYRRRLRPRAHYTLGWLPRWVRLASLLPGLANAATAAPTVGRAVRFAAGIDPRRSLPAFAPRTFRFWFAQHRDSRQRDGTPVMLIPDTFTNYFDPGPAIAAVTVLEDAGFAVSIPRRTVCCGLPWISTGQLTAARRIMQRTVTELRTAAEAQMPVVGLEPSCTAALRSDSVEFLGSAEAREVAGSVRTLTEVLTSSPGWQPPPLHGTAVVAQPHCHHSAVMGWDADEALLRRAGAELTRVGGCCGLAGNFGVERGHYEISAAVAETALMPAIRAAGPAAVLLADGFSCRTQLADLTGRSSVHLAQFLAGRLHGPE
ncbi:MAG: FAD-binding and (Fe-S)-binding domain-containing protein [Micromonosporaceae bacterium]